jgi:hypothetical protein
MLCLLRQNFNKQVVDFLLSRGADPCIGSNAAAPWLPVHNAVVQSFIPRPQPTVTAAAAAAASSIGNSSSSSNSNSNSSGSSSSSCRGSVVDYDGVVDALLRNSSRSAASAVRVTGTHWLDHHAHKLQQHIDRVQHEQQQQLLPILSANPYAVGSDSMTSAGEAMLFTEQLAAAHAGSASSSSSSNMTGSSSAYISGSKKRTRVQQFEDQASTNNSRTAAAAASLPLIPAEYDVPNPDSVANGQLLPMLLGHEQEQQLMFLSDITDGNGSDISEV